MVTSISRNSVGSNLGYLTTLVIRYRLTNLLGTVHDERSVPHDGFINQLAAQQESRRVLRTVDANARPRAVEQSDLRRLDRLGAVHAHSAFEHHKRRRVAIGYRQVRPLVTR